MGGMTPAAFARRKNGQAGGRGRKAINRKATRGKIVGVIAYAGYGGVSRGMYEAGVVPAVEIDCNEDCIDVLKANGNNLGTPHNRCYLSSYTSLGDSQHTH